MSSGHRHKSHTLTSSELNDLLSEALAHPKVSKLLATPFKVITNQDIPLLGSSSVSRAHVYFDRDLKYQTWPFGVVPVGERRLDVKPGLIRHERLEPILEDVFGWPYETLAHPVAQHYEEKIYIWRGFDPRAVEKAFAPFIKHAETKQLKKVPTDLDLRPSLTDPKLLAHTRSAQEQQKKEQTSVGYVDPSKVANQKCELCSMFVKPKFGGPACTLVKSPIAAGGWCRRFHRGALERAAV